MNIAKVKIGILMILRSLTRRRIVLLLIVVVPLVFLSVVQLTSSDLVLPFKLASLNENDIIQMPVRISLTFFAIASVGFLISFISVSLLQKNCREGRRLVLCGISPLELFLAVFFALILITILISVYVGLLTGLMFPIRHITYFIIGLLLTGFIYGAYGMVIGTMFKGELEGILFILLLVNIDAGWLQNPLFYAQAQHKEIIQYLPAFNPSQVSIISAFTDFTIVPAMINSFIYGILLLLISFIFHHYKMRLKS